MAKLTKEQWQEIKEVLSGIWGMVYLECDGHLICAEVAKLKQRLVIQVYVDGVIKGSWSKAVEEDDIGQLTDIQRKFMHHRKVGLPKKYIAANEKYLGKKQCKQNGVYKKTIVPLPYFNNPSEFIAKLKKTCENIEITDYATHKERLAAKSA